jgi:serine phosphatase RsbU (regulator of sigma subunit)
MTPQKDIVIKSKKKVLFFVLLISLYLTYEFCFNVYEVISENKSSVFKMVYSCIVNLTLAALSGMVAGLSFKRITDSSPGLVINSMGILDNSGLVSAGMVFWTDVVEINTSKVIFSDCIVIKVKNPKRYITNQKNYFKRLWLEQEYKRIGSPINISISGLQFKFNDLFRIIQDRYLSNQVDTRTYELKKEKDSIQREKRELVDSINYAKRIQTALLPSSAVIRERIGENFILYLPKDIVSGDFYWVETVDDWVFFAVCDCTGHGVPGALINIVCNNALNRSIKEYGITSPAKILDKVAELIVESIGLDGEVKDGMDASICSFNKTTRELFWSGANIPLWIARTEFVYELIEHRPDKQAIGLTDDRQPFTEHKIQIQKGDILYLASDGYADQFGGENGKKLTRKKFKELLLLQRGISLEQQQVNLLNFHNEYKGKGDQIDDILVMGIRIES